jgi:hypothetical protein
MAIYSTLRWNEQIPQDINCQTHLRAEQLG